MSLIDWPLNRVNGKWVGSEQAEQTGSRQMVAEDLSEHFEVWQQEWRSSQGQKRIRIPKLEEGHSSCQVYLGRGEEMRRRGQRQAELKPWKLLWTKGIQLLSRTNWLAFPESAEIREGPSWGCLDSEPRTFPQAQSLPEEPSTGAFSLTDGSTAGIAQSGQDPCQSGEGEVLLPKATGSSHGLTLLWTHRIWGNCTWDTETSCRIIELFYSEMPDGLWGWLLTPPVKGGPGWAPHPPTYLIGWGRSRTSVGWGWVVVHRMQESIGMRSCGEKRRWQLNDALVM